MTDSASPSQPANRNTTSASARAQGDAASRPTALGIYDKPRHEMVTSIEVIAIALSAIWLLGTAVFFLVIPRPEPAPDGTGSLRFLMRLRPAQARAIYRTSGPINRAVSGRWWLKDSLHQGVVDITQIQRDRGHRKDKKRGPYPQADGSMPRK